MSSPAKNENNLITASPRPFDMSLSKPATTPSSSVIVSNTTMTSSSPSKKISRIDDVPPPASIVRHHARSSLDFLLAAVASSAATTNSDQHSSLLPECDQCFRTFPSVLTLAKHKFRDHSAAETTSTTIGSKIEFDTSITPTKLSSSTESDEIFCEICNKEFLSNRYLRQHRANVHGLQSKHVDTISSRTPTANYLYESSSVASVSPLNVKPKRQYTTGKNYCDLCNKEVCNKYFLRTHMFKMHGIVIDENKTVIANIDTLEKEQSGEKLRFRYVLFNHRILYCFPLNKLRLLVFTPFLNLVWTYHGLSMGLAWD